MGRAAFFRQRLPCVGLFFVAAAGVILGRQVPISGATFAIGAGVMLLAAFAPRLRLALPVGVALAFAAAQAWQFRESPAVRLAAQLTDLPQSAVVRFTVIEAPRLSPSITAQRCRFVARLDALNLGDGELHPGCRVLVDWNGQPPVYGGRYETPASIANCPPTRNPGAFDYAAWLANAGIRSQIQVLRSHDARLLEVAGNPVVRLAIASCAWIERTITLDITGTPEAVLIRAMVVGDTSEAPDSMKDAFRETGTFHLFSVSGLHVGIVAILLWTALGVLGVGRRTSVLVIIPALFFYALLTGLSPASLRAAIMLSVIAASLLIDRPPTPLNSLGAAGLVILLGDSSQLFNSGFQLSFGAVVAIVLLARPLQRRIEARFAPDPFLPTRLIPPLHHIALKLAGGVAALVAVSFAAWIASLPLTLYYFHLISFSSIPANLLAVPLSSAVIALSSVALVTAGLSTWLAEVFNQANYLLAKVLIFIVQAFSALPGSAVYFGPSHSADRPAVLTVLDASPGAATVAFAGGKSWLVDTGPEFFGDSVTLPFLRMNGVNRLDALVLTHGDAKHIAAAERVLPALAPRLVLDSGLKDRSPTRRQALAALTAAGRPATIANAGFTQPLDDRSRVTVLYPPAGLEAVYADDKAIVLRLEIGGFRALLMSDAGVATEQWLLAHARDRLTCDAIVMGRHVSGFSGDPDFLRAAAPRVVIASATNFPRSEDIRPEWAAAVRARGIDLRRQDETGAVTLTITRDAFTVAPFLPTGGPVRTYPLSHGPNPVR